MEKIYIELEGEEDNPNVWVKVYVKDGVEYHEEFIKDTSVSYTTCNQCDTMMNTDEYTINGGMCNFCLQ